MPKITLLSGAFLAALATQLTLVSALYAQAPAQPQVQARQPLEKPTKDIPELRVRRDLVINPVQSIKQYCCGGSMSSSRNCLDITLSNQAGSPMTWAVTRFVGVVPGECLKSHPDPSCANNPPGVICMNMVCEQYAADTTITTDGPAVTVPANGTAQAKIQNPAKLYKSGHVEVAAKVGGTASTTKLSTLPWGQCVL